MVKDSGIPRHDYILYNVLHKGGISTPSNDQWPMGRVLDDRDGCLGGKRTWYYLKEGMSSY